MENPDEGSISSDATKGATNMLQVAISRLAKSDTSNGYTINVEAITEMLWKVRASGKPDQLTIFTCVVQAVNSACKWMEIPSDSVTYPDSLVVLQSIMDNTSLVYDSDYLKKTKSYPQTVKPPVGTTTENVRDLLCDIYQCAYLEYMRDEQMGRVATIASSNISKPIKEELHDTKIQFEQLDKKLDSKSAEVNTRLEKTDEKVDKAPRENTAVLGIFAAVVLAFNASITLASSGLQVSKELGTFQVAFIVSIIGFMLFNALFVLFSFVSHIVSKSDESWPLLPKWTFIVINAMIVAIAVILGAISCGL